MKTWLLFSSLSALAITNSPPADQAAYELTLIVPFFDVSIKTLGMCVAGSLLAFAYGTPIKSRWKLFGYAMGGVFAGVWGVTILPDMLGWKWYDMDMQAAVGGCIALVSRWAIPLVIEHLPALWRRVTNSQGARNDQERDP